MRGFGDPGPRGLRVGGGHADLVLRGLPPEAPVGAGAQAASRGGAERAFRFDPLHISSKAIRLRNPSAAAPVTPFVIHDVLNTPAAPPDRSPAASSPLATPVAHRIRERLRQARARFHANDNIAAHLREGELEALQVEVAAQLEQVLRTLVIDTESDHNTRDTARRVAKMYLKEVFAGRYTPQPPVTEFPNVRQLSELMIVGPVTVRSACSHHLCPIIGRVWVGVMPNEHSALIGLSKYARLVEWVMTRPQIQEEAISQLAELLQDKMQPDGLAIVMEADHYCMQWRGVKDMDSRMTNSIMRGSFLKNPDLRQEFLSLLSRRHG
jgi:GTP cyclohydrolase I